MSLWRLGYAAAMPRMQGERVGLAAAETTSSCEHSLLVLRTKAESSRRAASAPNH